MGFARHYRKFIYKFGKIVRPLIDIISVDKKPRSNSKLKVDPKWHLTAEQQQAFDILKEKLTSPPVLTCPVISKPFKRNRNVCQAGLGAVLYQEHDGLDRCKQEVK